ncbi:hypothetical protein [Mycobacterium sp. 236(2023)]|uniref:hypothetical protein n=1 Tax=Mycobacterium sp. 236(2023) TaxID=3038163 RepID=UPI0024155AF1|nr:hypothetical protein [Mycobacterium sp. 236(2023)]MDG4667908.1 hypothetical protein [Mycobacterium sp. 236(2023)]
MTSKERSIRPGEWPSRYCATAIGTDPARIVEHIGGWLYDHMKQGWNTSVAAPVSRRSTALRILGVDTVDTSALLSGYDATAANAIAVDAGLYGSDSVIGAFVDRAARGRFNSIALWGDCGISSTCTIGFSSGSHRLSDAARRFKAHAYLALDPELSHPVAPVEEFQCTRRQAPLTIISDPARNA